MSKTQMLCPCCWLPRDAKGIITYGDRLIVEVRFECGHAIADNVDPVLYAGQSAEQVCRSVNLVALKQRGIFSWG